MFPLAALVLGAGYHVRADRIVPLGGLLVLTAAPGASLGLVLGTLVPITRLPLLFSLVITPLLFTGCTYYPWAALRGVRWFQALTLCNPLTYVGAIHRPAPATDIDPGEFDCVIAASLRGTYLSMRAEILAMHQDQRDRLGTGPRRPHLERATAGPERAAAPVPMQRMAQPEEIAAAVWLSSDTATYVTGTTLPVDGGYTAW